MRHSLTGTLTFVVLICAGGVAQSNCEGIRLKAASEKPSASEHLPTISISIENDSYSPIAIRRDRVVPIFTTERLNGGKWEIVLSAGVGRGVGSVSATPPKLSQEQVVKNALDDYVVLYPNESFVARRKMEPVDFGASIKAKTAPKGRYRVTFTYFDDLPESAPVYRSTWKATSNAVSVTVN